MVSTIEPGRKKQDSENGDSLSLDVSLDSDMERDIGGPAGAAPAVASASVDTAKEEIETDKAVAGQSTKDDDVDEPMADDVEVKNSLEKETLTPTIVEEAKAADVDDVAVEKEDDKPTEDIQIDVVEEPKEKPSTSESALIETPTDKVDSSQSESEIKAEETPCDVAVDNKPASIDALVKDEPIEDLSVAVSAEKAVVADSSVSDSAAAVQISEVVESVPEIVENVTTTLDNSVDPEFSEAISSTVSVAVPDVIVPAEEVSVTASVSIEDKTDANEVIDDECKPSSPKMPRIEEAADDAVDTTSGNVATVPVDVVETPAESIAAIAEEPISTSTEAIVSAAEAVAVDAASEAILSEVEIAKTIEADSTEPDSKPDTVEPIASDAVDAVPYVEPTVEPSDVELSAAPIVEPTVPLAEVVSSDDIAEIMAVEEEPVPATSLVDSSDATVPAIETDIPLAADTTAMEATPIIPNDEQMDVDEANSADSMDL